MNLYRSLLIRFGIACAVYMPLTAGAEVIFREDFDSLKDFTSTMHTTEKKQESDNSVIPEGWYGLYQGTQWSPETGYPENHASLEILARNADKARGGEGKSAVHWRESYDLGWKNWASDSQLVRLLGKQYDSLYVEFYIRFSPEWWGREHESNFMSKIFRVGSWSGEGSVYSGFDGNIGPLMIWDYKRDSYGVRNSIAFRGGPHGENYTFNNEFPEFMSLNYGQHTVGQAEGGEDPKLEDQVSGGTLVSQSSPISHEQVFGKSGQWTKVAFYLKINSSPGVEDGVLRQWINDVRIFNKENIPWIQKNEENRLVGWNYIAIGGNDFFRPYPNDARYEDWYAIDDLVVATKPLLGEESSNGDSGSSSPGADVREAPNPPSNISVN